MIRVLLLTAALGLVVSTAGACEFQKSVQAPVDPTVVASIEKAVQVPMSTSSDTLPATLPTVVEEAAE